MSDAYEPHREAADYAINAMEELQGVLALATERCEMAIGAAQHATGNTPKESAQNSVAFLQQVKEELDRLSGITNAAMDEMNRYGGGF